MCLRILPSRPEAEDALQEAYLAIWRNAGSFEPARGSAAAWLAVLTRNAAIDRLRRRRAPAASSADEAQAVDPAPLASDTIEARHEARRLHECLADIDQDDAFMIRHAFLGGSTYAELAAASGMPLGTVKSRIRRALLKMRERLA